MVNRPRPVCLVAIATITLMTLVPRALAQGTDRDLYAGALARERAARAALSDINAPAESSLNEVRAAVAAYLTLPNRHPSSGYSDNALWQAGRLSLDAFARFGDDRDRKTGVRLLRRFAVAYPTSKMAKRVAAAIDAIGDADSEAVPADRTAPPSVTINAAAVAAPAVAITGPTATIRGIKRTVLPDTVRIVIELDAEVMFHEERIASPDRVFLDLTPARASPALRNQTLRFQGDADVVRQVRLGSHENRTTRVVLDAGGVASYNIYALYNPYRLVVDCVRGTAPEPLRPLLAAKLLAPTWTRRLPSVAAHGATTIREALTIATPRPAPTPPAVAPKPMVTDESRIATSRLTPPPVKSANLEPFVSSPPLLAVRPLAPAWSRRLSTTAPRSTAAIEAAEVAT